MDKIIYDKNKKEVFINKKDVKLFFKNNLNIEINTSFLNKMEFEDDKFYLNNLKDLKIEILKLKVDKEELIKSFKKLDIKNTGKINKNILFNMIFNHGNLKQDELDKLNNLFKNYKYDSEINYLNFVENFYK